MTKVTKLPEGDEMSTLPRLEFHHGDKIVSFIPQPTNQPDGDEAGLMALNIRANTVGFGMSTTHMIFDEECWRQLFNYLGVWLHKNSG